MSKPDPLDQLTRLRIDVDDAVRDHDLAAVRSELRRRPAHVPRARRWTLGVVVAVMLAGPAAAVASDSAAPGDLLYPIKRAAEPIVRLFDGDVVAEHRVDEVAVLIDRRSEDALIEERIAVARNAVAETDAPEYEERLDEIVDRWEVDRAAARPPVTGVAPPATQRTEPRSDREPEPPAVDTPTTATTPTDDARDTPPTDDVRDTPPPSGSTTTTTTTIDEPPPDRDRPPPDDRPRDRP